jgi:hypothetical protein
VPPVIEQSFDGRASMQKPVVDSSHAAVVPPPLPPSSPVTMLPPPSSPITVDEPQTLEHFWSEQVAPAWRALWQLESGKPHVSRHVASPQAQAAMQVMYDPQAPPA